jgi:peptidoglycan/LPS O-acetylase OafA/YrhL
MGAVGFAAALAAGILLFPVGISGRLFSLDFIEPVVFVGEGNWESAVYALWDSIFAVGMFLAALTFFRHCFNKDSRFGRFLSQQSYAVYIIHIPIIVFIAVALKEFSLQPLLKFGVVSLIVIPVCFAAAYVIRKIPGVSRVL